jgi:hypothetical protein
LLAGAGCIAALAVQPALFDLVNGASGSYHYSSCSVGLPRGCFFRTKAAAANVRINLLGSSASKTVASSDRMTDDAVADVSLQISRCCSYCWDCPLSSAQPVRCAKVEGL